MSYLRDDPKYSDIEPIYLTEDDQKIVHVVCPEEYEIVMAYFRGVFAKQIFTEEAFEITTYAIRLNPSNYTVWHFRRQCIDALNHPWERELRLVSTFCENYPKNYQIWHHRKCCLMKVNTPQIELDATEKYISDDLKNYHVWSYRQWLLKTYPYELSYAYLQQWYTEYLLMNDVFASSLSSSSQQTSDTTDSATTTTDTTDADTDTATATETTTTTTTTANSPNKHQQLINEHIDNNTLQSYLSTLQVTSSDEEKLFLVHLTPEQFQSVPLHALPIWPYELHVITQLLREDIRNNSAWNQRAFVLQYGYGISLSPRRLGPPTTTTLTQLSIDQIFVDEFLYSAESLYIVRKNESIWNYLLGLTKSYQCRCASMIVHLCYHLLHQDPTNRFILSCLVEILLIPHVQSIQQMDTSSPVDIYNFIQSHQDTPFTDLVIAIQDQFGTIQNDYETASVNINPNPAATTASTSTAGTASTPVMTTVPMASIDNLHEAKRLCELLVKHDSLRFKYWIHRRNQIDYAITQLSPTPAATTAAVATPTSISS